MLIIRGLRVKPAMTKPPKEAFETAPFYEKRIDSNGFQYTFFQFCILSLTTFTPSDSNNCCICPDAPKASLPVKIPELLTTLWAGISFASELHWLIIRPTFRDKPGKPMAFAMAP
jgi:hypothetical protein